MGPKDRDFKSKHKKNRREKISIRLFCQVRQLFFPEFSSLDSNPQCQGNSGTGTSIFLPFNLEIAGGILDHLASRSCIYIQYCPRQDGCAYSFASRDQSSTTSATTCLYLLPAFIYYLPLSTTCLRSYWISDRRQLRKTNNTDTAHFFTVLSALTQATQRLATEHRSSQILCRL